MGRFDGTFPAERMGGQQEGARLSILPVAGIARQVAEAAACCWRLPQRFAMLSAAKGSSASFRAMLLNGPQRLVPPA